MTSLRELSLVRSQTCTDLIFLELGLGSVKVTVAKRHQTFLHKVKARDGFQNSLLNQALSLVKKANSPMCIAVTELESLGNLNPILMEFCQRQYKVIHSSSYQPLTCHSSRWVCTSF